MLYSYSIIALSTHSAGKLRPLPGEFCRMSTCAKCQTFVPPENDATLLVAIAQDMKKGGDSYKKRANAFAYAFVGTITALHLLPVWREGTLVCPGSPSRAQYLLGQPRDTRPAFPYFPESEATYRAAYEELQTLAREPQTKRAAMRATQ